jgi:hypothetical protein
MESLDRFLFRGFSNTKVWVFGSLIYHGEQPIIEFVKKRHPEDNRVLATEWVYVDPKSVGQWTTLKDGKGNPIFDGDILKDDCPEWTYVVFWEQSQLRWAYKRIDMPTEQTYALAMSPMALRHYTVIGNIYENSLKKA